MSILKPHIKNVEKGKKQKELPVSVEEGRYSQYCFQSSI